MISLPLVNDIHAAGPDADRTAAAAHPAPGRVHPVARSLGDRPRSPQREGGGARRRAHARPLRSEERRHGARADRARPGLHRVRRPRPHRRPAPERHGETSRIPFNYRKVAEGTSRTTSSCSPATSSSFPEEVSMARDLAVHPIHDESLALRVARDPPAPRAAGRRGLRHGAGGGDRLRALPAGPVRATRDGAGGATDLGIVRRTAVSGELESRLYVIKQEILSRDRLTELIKRFNLYPELRQRRPVEDVLTRRATTSTSSRPGRNRSAAGRKTVSFTLSYTGDSREKVADVTNAIAPSTWRRTTGCGRSEAMRTSRVPQDAARGRQAAARSPRSGACATTPRATPAQLPQQVGVTSPRSSA